MPGFVPLPFAHHDWRNPDLEPGRTACPPSEELSPLGRATLAARSPCNMVHIDLPAPVTQANRLLGDWLDQGVLVRREGAYYLLATRFSLEAEPDLPVIRWSVFGGLRLSPWGTDGVFPLEGLPAPAREGDQEPLRAIRATRAQLAPVFGVFDDPGLDLCAMGAEVEATFNPLAVFREAEVIHRLWRLPGKFEAAVAASLAGREVFIADGVPRYEAALAYQAERGPGGGERPWDWAFACLANLALQGAAVLPLHRLLLPLLPQASLEAALAKARAGFSLHVVDSLDALEACPVAAAFVLESDGVKTLLVPWPADATDAAGTADAARAAGIPGTGGAGGETIPTDAGSPADAAPARIGAQAADEAFLRDCLGLSEADMAGGAYLRHTSRVAEARLALAQGEALAALFLKPVSIGHIRAMLHRGQALPRHAAFFHPKTPTGLLLHLFR